MLTGTADLDLMAARAPAMTSLDPAPASFAHVEVLQASFEMPAAARQVTLPPGLHPTNPAMAVFLAWRVTDSPWGPFTMAQVRVACRSGVRPRGLVVGCIVDNPAAGRALASSWGLPARPGQVRLARRYDAVELEVFVDGAVTTRLVAVGPDPLAPTDVQYSVTMTAAVTPRGLRLVQLEPEYTLHRVERVRPRLEAFNGSSWGEPALQPTHPVAATIGVGAIEIPRLRFVCRPDVLAFGGTEAVP
jgi:Acetoacetate decarboxylase (ADC)